MPKGPRHRAGQLRVPITIERHDGTLNARGQLDQASANWDSQGNGWAAIESLAGGELERARMHVADATHRADLRWRSDVTITPEDRLKRRDTSKVYHIGMVHNVDERNQKVQLLLVETQVGSADV